MKTINKEMIIKNYNEVMLFNYPNGRNCYELNKAMGYIDFKKKEGCRYYLWPTYTNITDYFTAEEMAHNFYLGDIMIFDFKKYPDSDPKKWFGPDWTEDYGMPRRWSIDLND